MIYFIKLIYQTFILPPGIIILAMLILYFILKHKKNNAASFILLFTLVFYLLTTPLLGNILIRSLESKYTLPKNIKGDTIVMLGGGATLDTPNLGGEGHLSGYAANRLITCVELYHKLKLPIIVSGGKVYTSTGTEAVISKNILINMGIPENKIIIDDKSLTTEENAKNIKILLKKYNYNNPILVTSAFHMERAVINFHKMKVNVLPFPTDYQTNIKEHFEINDLIPSANSMLEISMSLKEYLGILAAKF